MAAPELRPRLLPLLQAKNEQLCRPEDGPGAVCEITANWLAGEPKYPPFLQNLQHAVRLLPTQVVLNIYRRLSLHGETDQRNDQEAPRICISLLCSLLR